jgi:phospholipid transport system substrate-binding protein
MTVLVRLRFPITVSKTSWLRRAALLGAVAVALVATAAPSHAARSAGLSPAETVASRAGTRAGATARAGGTEAQLTNRFRTLLRRYSNVSSVASFSLGKYARELPAGRRPEFNRLVEDFTARLFAAYAGSFAGHQVEVLRSNPRTARDIVVDSRILFADNRNPSPVKWLVSKRGGGYTVYDVNVQGVWLSLYIRSKFVSILKQNNGDFDALFAFLRQ